MYKKPLTLLFLLLIISMTSTVHPPFACQHLFKYLHAWEGYAPLNPVLMHKIAFFVATRCVCTCADLLNWYDLSIKSPWMDMTCKVLYLYLDTHSRKLSSCAATFGHLLWCVLIMILFFNTNDAFPEKWPAANKRN